MFDAPAGSSHGNHLHRSKNPPTSISQSLTAGRTADTCLTPVEETGRSEQEGGAAGAAGTTTTTPGGGSTTTLPDITPVQQLGRANSG